MKIISIDYGLKKIGLALGETESKMVEPFGVIKVKSGIDKAIKQIDSICKREKVEKIVVGLPESGLINQIKNFAFKLVKITNLPLVYEEETLTSKEAVDTMVKVGRKRNFRKKWEDAIAAALILQNYLNKNYV